MSGGGKGGRIAALHLAVIAVLFAAQFLLPAYHHGNVARIMVLASFAVGYNVLLGYTGLLSLGHAMFFAAGLYGAGLPLYYFEIGALQAFGLGLLASLALALCFGLVALRASGIAFLIVTLMFAQAFFLATLYFNEITLGDQGFVLSEQARTVTLGGVSFSFADPVVKYNAALLLFACCMLVCLALVRSPIGRVWVAIRENEPRTRMLGYNTYVYKLIALVVSGVMAGAAGAGYALLFAYVGSTFATIQYSIYALLWTLLGGVGTVLGPFVGTGLMFYLIDIAGDFTTSYLLVVGVVLLVLILWYPKGLLGSLRARWLPWLP